MLPQSIPIHVACIVLRASVCEKAVIMRIETRKENLACLCTSLVVAAMLVVSAWLLSSVTTLPRTHVQMIGKVSVCTYANDTNVMMGCAEPDCCASAFCQLNGGDLRFKTPCSSAVVLTVCSLCTFIVIITWITWQCMICALFGCNHSRPQSTCLNVFKRPGHWWGHSWQCWWCR